MRDFTGKQTKRRGITSQKGDGIGSILAKLGPVLLPLLGEALKKPAEELGNFIGRKVKQLTGGSVSHKDINKLISMIAQQEGMGTKLSGGAMCGRGTKLSGGSKYVTEEIGMASTGGSLLLAGQRRLKKK